MITAHPGTLSNDFFVNLLDMSTKWSKSSIAGGICGGHDRASGELEWTATPVDLIFGSNSELRTPNSELRAVAEVYASSDGGEESVQDFVAAGTKVRNLDRFDTI